MAKDLEDAVVQVFFVRNGRLIGRDHFFLRLTGEETKSEILSSFIKQFYAGTPYLPGGTDDAGRAERYGVAGRMADRKTGA